jgi:hypothetical protein
VSFVDSSKTKNLFEKKNKEIRLSSSSRTVPNSPRGITVTDTDVPWLTAMSRAAGKASPRASSLGCRCPKDWAAQCRPLASTDHSYKRRCLLEPIRLCRFPPRWETRPRRETRSPFTRRKSPPLQEGPLAPPHCKSRAGSRREVPGGGEHCCVASRL